VGATAPALTLAVVAIAATATNVHADPCTGVTASGDRFPICFDVGNRLWVMGGTDGVSAGVALRHIIHFDDEPDLVWKLEHAFGDAAYGGLAGHYSAVVYAGRYLRHARDGKIVIPLGTPRKVFLPFDIGVETEVGRVDGEIGGMSAVLGVVRTAALVDVSRSEDFRRRLAFGPVARWDIDFDRKPLTATEHVVAPFSLVGATAHIESSNGLSIADVRVEGGSLWRGGSGWHPVVSGAISIERIVLAIDDRPIALVLGARYDSATDELLGQVGARFVLVQHRDARVSLARR
jgi:hypothetical protein